MLSGTSLVENLAGPSPKGFGRHGQQPVKLLQEVWQHAAHVRHDFVRVGTHQATRVHHDPEVLRSKTEAIPIALLDLPSLVRVQEEVPSSGAPRQSPSLSGFDDATSRHAPSCSENRADEGALISLEFRRSARSLGGGAGSLAGARHRATSLRNLRECAAVRSRSVGSVGRICVWDLWATSEAY